MTTAPSLPIVSVPRTNSLALAFQEILTIVVRTRFDVHPMTLSANDARVRLRQGVLSAAQSVRGQGYSEEISQIALYAAVGFLDESVLASRDPVFANWAGFTLQQELFHNQIAGEIFFRHVADLLNRPDSTEVADILELHGLCLLLGFRGRFAAGDASEIDAITRRIREKIAKIRGPFSLGRTADSPVVAKQPAADRWVRNLYFVILGLAVTCLALYLGFLLLLNQGVPNDTYAVLGQEVKVQAQAMNDVSEIPA